MKKPNFQKTTLVTSGIFPVLNLTTLSIKDKFCKLLKGFLAIVAIMILTVSCKQQPKATENGNALLKFETIVVENFLKHPKATEAHHGFDYKVSFLYPKEYSDNAVLEKLQKKFLLYTLGEKHSSLPPEKAIDAFIADCEAAYHEDIKNLQSVNSDPNWVTGWKVICNNSIPFMNDALLQLKTETGLYPYAAHIFESSSYHLFNLQTGNEYSRDDIFKPEVAESIRQLIIPELLKSLHFSSSELQKFNVWKAETNFAITEKGICIVYNDNDFDYGIVGSHSLTIPYSKIISYLREGTPVWEVAKQYAKESGNEPQQKMKQDDKEPLFGHLKLGKQQPNGEWQLFFDELLWINGEDTKTLTKYGYDPEEGYDYYIHNEVEEWVPVTTLPETQYGIVLYEGEYDSPTHYDVDKERFIQHLKGEEYPRTIYVKITIVSEHTYSVKEMYVS